MNKRKWIIPAGAFISMSFNGTIRTFLGTALPAIRSSLNLSFVEAGTLTAFLQIGFCSSVFIGGPLADVFDKNRLIGTRNLLTFLGGFHRLYSERMIPLVETVPAILYKGGSRAQRPQIGDRGGWFNIPKGHLILEHHKEGRQ